MDADCIIPESILDHLEAIGRARIRKTFRHLGATIGSRVLVTDFSAAYFDLFHEHFIHCEYYHFFGVKKLDEVSKLLSDMLVLRNSAEFVLEFEVVGNVSNPSEGSTAKRNLLPLLQSLREPSPVAPDKPNEKPAATLRPFPRYTDSEATGSDVDSYHPTPSPPSSPVKPAPLPKATAATPEALALSNTATPKVASPAAVIQSIFARPAAVKLETKHKMGPFVEHEERRNHVSVMMHRVMTENSKTPSHGLTKVYEAHKDKYPKAPPEEIEFVETKEADTASPAPVEPSAPLQTVPVKRVSDSESSGRSQTSKSIGIKSSPPATSAAPKQRDLAPSTRVVAKEAYTDSSGSYSSDSSSKPLKKILAASQQREPVPLPRESAKGTSKDVRGSISTSSSVLSPPPTILASPKQREPVPLPRESVKSPFKGARGSTVTSSLISSPPPSVHVPPLQRKPLPSQREALEAARSASAFGLTSNGATFISPPPPRASVPSVHRDSSPFQREPAKSAFNDAHGSTSSGSSVISSPSPTLAATSKQREPAPLSLEAAKSPFRETSGSTSSGFSSIASPPPIKPKASIPNPTSARNSTVNSSGRSSPLFELDPIELPPPPKPKRTISPRALNKPNKRSSSELGGPPLRPAFCRDAGFDGLQEKKTKSETEPIRQAPNKPIPPMPSMTPASSSSSVSNPTRPNTKKKQLYTVSAHKCDAEYTSDSD